MLVACCSPWLRPTDTQGFQSLQMSRHYNTASAPSMQTSRIARGRRASFHPVAASMTLPLAHLEQFIMVQTTAVGAGISGKPEDYHTMLYGFKQPHFTKRGTYVALYGRESVANPSAYTVLFFYLRICYDSNTNPDLRMLANSLRAYLSSLANLYRRICLRT